MSKSQKRQSPKQRDDTPVTVPFAATRTRETPGIAPWAHRAVWTDRMLETLLTNQVKGGKWNTLIDKVFHELNLFYSAQKVLGQKGAAGIDRQTVDDFAEHEREELRQLLEQLRKGTSVPATQPIRPRMVQLLPALSLEHLQQLRRNDSPTAAADAPQTPSPELPTIVEKSALAERLLYETWVASPEHGP